MIQVLNLENTTKEMKNRVKLLVVDDNAEFGIGVKMLLSKDDVEVYTASNGTDGLEMTDSLKPDIIVLDVVMPGIDGIEVCRTIRKNPDFSNISIIMLSGFKTHTDQMSDGLEAGANEYITRPIPNRELLARLRAFISLKQSEKALEQSEAKYKMLFDTMIIGYAHHQIITDEAGLPVDYTFLEINPEFERIIGMTRDEIIGRRVLEILPETESLWINKFGEVALKGTKTRFINYARSFDRYFEVYAFSPSDGEFSALFYDVTENELAKARIEQFNRELEKLNNDKDKFFSIIAHDLRSPFNTILGFSELMKSDGYNLSGMEVVEYSTLIHKSASQTLRLLENLLQWARLEQGKIPFNPIEINLDDLIEKIISMSGDQHIKKNIELCKVIPKHLTVHADEEMLMTIMRNLISNAVKFTHNGRRVEIKAEMTATEIQISVSDNGIGMSEVTMKQLFVQESHISTPGAENEKGAGLGLILCKDFIEKHGGKIWIESEEGKGSKFKFSLPLTL